MKFVVDLPKDTPLKSGTVLHTFGYPEPEIFGFFYVHPDHVASLGIFVPSWFDSPVRTSYRYLQHWMLHPYLWRYLKGVQHTVSILRILFFLLLAGGSQLLSIGWRDRELQVATGLGFYSLTSLVISGLQACQISGMRYLYLNRIAVICFICSLIYWLVCFAQQEAERRAFTPEMQRIRSSSPAPRVQPASRSPSRKRTIRVNNDRRSTPTRTLDSSKPLSSPRIQETNYDPGYRPDPGLHRPVRGRRCSHGLEAALPVLASLLRLSML